MKGQVVYGIFNNDQIDPAPRGLYSTFEKALVAIPLVINQRERQRFIRKVQENDKMDTEEKEIVCCVLKGESPVNTKGITLFGKWRIDRYVIDEVLNE